MVWIVPKLKAIKLTRQKMVVVEIGFADRKIFQCRFDLSKQEWYSDLGSGLL